MSTGVTFASVLDRLARIENPYPGLRPFEPYQSHLFFGRDQHIAQLIDRLQHSRFVAVVGVSGCGKSSLVFAGLIPALERGLIWSAAAHWRVVVAKPRGAPYANLAKALKVDPATLRKSSHGILEAARELPEGETLVVVIDQFEELFRYREEDPATEEGLRRQKEDAAEAAEFVRLLLTTAASQPPVYVVITMRSEYLGECAEFRGLPEALNDSQYLVPRMSREQRRQAIENPLGSVKIDASLVQRLLNDAGDEPDQLPILQHALMRTWNQWHESDPGNTRPISVDDYSQVGGWGNAINQHANELTRGQSEDLTATIFKRLTAKSRDKRERRDPATLADLYAIADAGKNDVMKVVDRFSSGDATFLLRSGDRIDISHESLIRRWDKLVEWVKQEEKSKATFLYLLTRSEGEPLQALDLAAAQDWNRLRNKTTAWAKHYAAESDLNKVLEFLKTSEGVEKKRKRAAMHRFWIAVCAAVLFAFLAALSYYLRRQAAYEKLSAEARRLVATSNLHQRQGEFDNAVLDAATSMQLLPSVENDVALRTAMALLPRTLWRNEHGGPVNGVVFSRDGRYLATASDDQQARIFYAEKGVDAVSHCQHNSPVKSVEFSPDARFIATVSQDPGGHVCDVQTGKDVLPAGGTVRVVAVAFSADGLYLASAGDDKVARVLKVGTWNPAAPSMVHRAPITALAFGASSRYLATASDRIRIWDWKAGTSMELPNTGNVNVLAFGVEDKYLAAASDDRSAYVFDTKTGKQISRLIHRGRVRALAFSKANEIVTGSDDNTARVFKPETGEELIHLVHDREVDAVALAGDGKYAATGSLDKTSRVVDSNSGREILRMHHQSGVYAVALSPDGRRVATGSGDHFVRVFETATPGEILRAPDVGEDDLVELTAEGNQIVVSGQQGIRVFNSGGHAATPRTDLGETITAIAVSPDGTFIATGSDDSYVWVLNTKSGQKHVNAK